MSRHLDDLEAEVNRQLRVGIVLHFHDHGWSFAFGVASRIAIFPFGSRWGPNIREDVSAWNRDLGKDRGHSAQQYAQDQKTRGHE